MIVMTFEEPSISETPRPDVLAEYAEGADDPQRPLGPYEGIGMLPNKNLLVHPRESLVCAAVTIGDQRKVGPIAQVNRRLDRLARCLPSDPISSSDIIRSTSGFSPRHLPVSAGQRGVTNDDSDR